MGLVKCQQHAGKLQLEGLQLLVLLGAHQVTLVAAACHVLMQMLLGPGAVLQMRQACCSNSGVAAWVKMLCSAPDVHSAWTSSEGARLQQHLPPMYAFILLHSSAKCGGYMIWHC